MAEESPAILYLETSTEICSVAVSRGKNIASLQESHLRYRHGEWLTIAIRQALETAEIERKELNAISITIGPGSYTGLRVGLATAKALCLGLNIPLISHSTLAVIAYGMKNIYSGQQEFLMPMIDARRMEVYTALFNGNMQRLKEDKPLILDKHNCKKILQEFNPLLIGGNGAEKSLPLWQAQDTTKIRYHLKHISAAHQLQPAIKKFKNDMFDEFTYVKPTYLKNPNITKPTKTL